MPNRDGTGPNGAGPRTGRDAGWCRGWIRNNPIHRERFGWFRRTVDPKEEASLLKKEAAAMKEDLAAIEKRLTELEKE